MQPCPGNRIGTPGGPNADQSSAQCQVCCTLLDTRQSALGLLEPIRDRSREACQAQLLHTKEPNSQSQVVQASCKISASGPVGSASPRNSIPTSALLHALPASVGPIRARRWAQSGSRWDQSLRAHSSTVVFPIRQALAARCPEPSSRSKARPSQI